MWSDGAEWQCDARFVIVTNGPIEEALAYKGKVGNGMEWYSSSESPFAADTERRCRCCGSGTAHGPGSLTRPGGNLGDPTPT